MSKNNQYIIEFYPVGNSIKVSAIDPLTLAEAVVVGSPNASREDLAKLAVRKLEYVLNKIADENK